MARARKRRGRCRSSDASVADSIETGAAVSIESGLLYVVATPIGNLDDISARALQVLAEADLIAAEDTRQSARLLRHHGISTPVVSLHRHNERETTARLLERMARGVSVALVSDAGTPLVSDPGAHLVRGAQDRGLRVVPIPGASALICALSASGMPSDRFVFEGFLASRPAARRRRLQALAGEERTLVFFEAPHRILESVRDMAAVFGAERRAVIARELTKLFEEVHAAALAELQAWLRAKPERQKGEFVVVVDGAPEQAPGDVDAADERVLSLLLEALPVSRAAALAAKLTGKKRGSLYQRALEMTRGDSRR
jgi:16S rRNA (cytidine1402-2'-O)-methyltransferase